MTDLDKMARPPFTCGHNEGSWTIQRPPPRIGIGKALAAAAGLLALTYVVGQFI